MKAKVCGISTLEQVETCVKFGASFCGFILNYPKSHRFISFDKAKELTNFNKGKTKYVGVLVNPNNDELKKFSKLKIDYFQIYGNYDYKTIIDIKSKFKKKIIAAIQVINEKDILSYKKLKNKADIVLWDSSGLERSVGWDYRWIKSVPNNITKMIAGNIKLKNLNQIFNLVDIVDVSGALETNKVKDIEKIKKFLNEIKKLNDQN